MKVGGEKTKNACMYVVVIGKWESSAQILALQEGERSSYTDEEPKAKNQVRIEQKTDQGQ